MNPQGTLGGVVVGGFTSGGGGSGTSGTEAQPPNSLFSLFEPPQHQRGGGGTVDPMKILTELDRGLRSPRIGDQCEAIVFFAKLISSYPFPLVVNAAFLKLADLFRVSHNFVRYCILLSFQQSDVHLNKIINVEEILRRIATVLQSNDPIARSITLRILGSMASFVSERHNIHHG
jgi:integrator complex subunit 7